MLYLEQEPIVSPDPNCVPGEAPPTPPLPTCEPGQTEECVGPITTPEPTRPDPEQLALPCDAQVLNPGSLILGQK
jgi:hypothetical protein